MSIKTTAAAPDLVISTSGVVHHAGCKYVSHYSGGKYVREEEEMNYEQHPVEADYWHQVPIATFRETDQRVTLEQLASFGARYRACRVCCPDVPPCRAPRDTVSKAASTLTQRDVGRRTPFGVIASIELNIDSVIVKFAFDAHVMVSDFHPDERIDFMVVARTRSTSL